nr:MAG TPA: hypothetical protein [Caudoviricetes sp.]
MYVLFFAIITLLNVIGLMITNDIGLPGTILIMLVGTIGIIFSDSMDTLQRYGTLYSSMKVYRLGVIFSCVIELKIFAYLLYRLFELYF